MAILVTGGTGYIGSHTVIELLNNDYEVIILDNLSNSSIKIIDKITSITNKKFDFIQADIRDKEVLDKIFKENRIDAVIHFAGLKAVGESVQDPIKYYNNNVNGTLMLLEAMSKYKVLNLVFSSSATVYGDPLEVPITENMPVGNTINPYGTSKYFIERILEDVYISNPNWSMMILRYFNPIGAHKSGKIGDNPNGIPNNLMPYISQVAVGKLKELSVFGNDYNTPDGTGIRDYIHVVDLAVGHLNVLEKYKNHHGVHVYNLGTGIGYSVLDIINAFQKVNNIDIPYKIAPRREGDIAKCFANPRKAKEFLNWEAKFNLNDMMIDTWRWQSNNPNGYND